MPAGHPYPYLIQSEKGGARDVTAFFGGIIWLQGLRVQGLVIFIIIGFIG
jgi:hypothetical protein